MSMYLLIVFAHIGHYRILSRVFCAIQWALIPYLFTDENESESCSVMSDSLGPHGLYIQSMEFSRPEYWSGQPFPSPEDLPTPGIKPGSPTLQANSLPTELSPRSVCMLILILQFIPPLPLHLGKHKLFAASVTIAVQ